MCFLCVWIVCGRCLASNWSEGMVGSGGVVVGWSAGSLMVGVELESRVLEIAWRRWMIVWWVWSLLVVFVGVSVVFCREGCQV